MAGFKRFEDIKAWQKAREVTREIYRVTAIGDFSKDYDLRSQIRRASISIMANIAEGFGRKSDKEFANFLNIAHASACEAQSHLYVALDLNYTNQQSFDNLYQSLVEITRMIYALSEHLRKS
ncbi:MAG TPA: four helix bundle protein [Pyrinomonadaceae bacterium]|nr:four helix bundle protein [Pyrinomonadaceae bacterium]